MAEAKGINPEITTEVTEEVKRAPSKLRQKLHELKAMRERTSTQFFQVLTFKGAYQHPDWPGR